LAGIPLTFREVSRSFAVVTGHWKSGTNMEWSPYAKIDTLVILMGTKQRAFIANSLIAAGRSPREPVAFVEHGSLPDQRVVETDLAAVAEGKVEVGGPAVMVVGEVVRQRNRLVESISLSHTKATGLDTAHARKCRDEHCMPSTSPHGPDRCK
jgi:uroporphyrin-III C-methyltransferase